MKPCPHCGKTEFGHNSIQCEIDQRFLSLGVAKALPAGTPRITRMDVTMVSAGAHNKIADLEQALQLLLVADEADKDAAYTYLNSTREALYKHIADLERQLNVKRTVKKRF